VTSLKKQVLIATVLFLLFITPLCNVAYAANYERLFQLADHPGGSVSYGLTVSVTSSLYNYYSDKNHDLYSSADFAKFITPYAVKPIADALFTVYSNKETFTDAVLGIAQQIPYQVSVEVYPIETLKWNYGDCGSLSLLVASILKAGGLDIVLLEYPSAQHLNVGVNLPNKPAYARSNVHWVDYNSKRYYIAETTGANFPNGWCVGECPPELRQLSPNVVSVENDEQRAPGQVSASYKPLNPSHISISVSSSFTMENSLVAIAGVVSPSNAENVSIYVSSIAGDWQVLATVAVGANGTYLYQWKPQSGGIYYLETSWSGNADYAGADSASATLYVVPFYGVLAGALGFLLLILVLVFWFMNRRSVAAPMTMEKPETPAPPSPEEKTLPAPEETVPQPSQTPEETERQTPQSEEPPQPEATQQPQPSQTTTSEEATQTQDTKTLVEEKPAPTEETSPSPSPQIPESQQTQEPNQTPTPSAEEHPQQETPVQNDSTPENTTANPT
jgi:hypothetical protein